MSTKSDYFKHCERMLQRDKEYNRMLQESDSSWWREMDEEAQFSDFGTEDVGEQGGGAKNG